MRKKLRVAYIDGPGDAIESFGFWQENKDNPNVTHVPFSGQFYDVCESLSADVLVITENMRLEKVSIGKYRIENWGNPAVGKRGLSYHLADFYRGISVLWAVVQFRADVILTTDRPNPFLLYLVRPFGIKVIINLHCTLWNKYGTPQGVNKWLLRFNASYFKHGCAAIACVSEDVKKQIRSVIGHSEVPMVDFLPFFRASTFEGIPPLPPKDGIFHILYVGRMEESKGIFDLLNIAASFKDAGKTDFVFELCGAGSALEDLQKQVVADGLSETFILNGHCNQQRIREAMGRSNIVVVPTKTSFNEGFNMVIVEALLAGRPVITSSVCPAVAYVGKAIRLVRPDDWRSYAEAILELSANPSAYHELRLHAKPVASRFLSESTSFKAALEYIMAGIDSGHPIVSREIEPQPNLIT